MRVWALGTRADYDGLDTFGLLGPVDNTKVSFKEALEGFRVVEKAEYDKLRAALNRIGLLGSGEAAYTSEFTTTVMGIVREVLK